MPINYIKGDLIKLADNGEFDMIVHGCNCFCAMKSGIAKQIAKKSESAKIVDLKTVKGDKSKLGTATYGFFKNSLGTFVTVINAYSYKI